MKYGGKHGIGKCKLFNSYYEGEFYNDQKDGYGIEFNYDLTKDINSIDLNKIRTVVTKCNNNDSIFENYKNGLSPELKEKYNGKKCEYYYDNGVYFEGEFLNDLKEGYGTLYLSDGSEMKMSGRKAIKCSQKEYQRRMRRSI